jgi:hypothetical protein
MPYEDSIQQLLVLFLKYKQARSQSADSWTRGHILRCHWFALGGVWLSGGALGQNGFATSSLGRTTQ